MKKSETKFSLLLRQLRKNSELTQKQVADALGLERSTYTYYETGVTQPSCWFVIQLCKIFNVEYSVFMDAIADAEFDKSDDGNNFSTLTKGSWKERQKMYELTSTEQKIVLACRVDPNKRAKIMKIVDEREN